MSYAVNSSITLQKEKVPTVKKTKQKQKPRNHMENTLLKVYIILTQKLKLFKQTPRSPRNPPPLQQVCRPARKCAFKIAKKRH